MSAPARLPPAQPEQPEHPARQELERPGRRREGERLEAERRLRFSGRELEVSASDEPGEPAVGAAEVEDQHPGVVLERLDQEEVEREALARARGAQHQRVPHVAREEVVVVGRPPGGLEHRERLAAEVPALGRASRRPEQRREARGHARRDEHLPHLPGTGLGRQPREPGRELAVRLAYHLGVVRGEEAPEIAVDALDPPEIAVQSHGERSIPVAHSVRLELDERGAQPVGLGRRGRINHRGGRALRLLHVRHHRVALGEVVPLRPADPAPRGLDGPRPPLERHGHRRVQAVELAEEVGVRLSGWGEERVEDHRLAVEREVAPLGLELREREPPVHPAPRRAVPHRARPVDQLRE